MKPTPPPPLLILTIDDHLTAAERLAALLRAAGHVVVHAANQREAQLAVRLVAPDVLLVGDGLPGLDRYSVTEQLLARLPRRPLTIAVSSYPDLDRRSKEVGFHYHFAKPVEPEMLIDLLDTYARKLPEVP